ncbi:MAG TPA: YkgJ family cysteine cluster protein [Actinomycetota bacterium]|nr:YkgJ family cysteine cluster protein [Actinomycetota bacterium]
MDLDWDRESSEQSDLQRMMADLRKKGWGARRLEKVEQGWDKTLGWSAWGRSQSPQEQSGSGQAEHDPWAPVEWEGERYRIDPPNPAPEAVINCAERVHLCKAVCCKLNFVLTPSEVRSGKVKWDPKLPYLIAHGEDGYCAHLDHSKGCTIFEDRPALCRRFDCRTDGRVWIDFEGMIPNKEWIDGIVANHDRLGPKKSLPVVQVTAGPHSDPEAN